MSKVWLITGCSTGIGRATALAALAHGDRVLATGLDLPSMEDLKEKGATTLVLDVTWGEAEIDKVVAEGFAVYGQIDILFNNAGFGILGSVEEFSDQEFFNQFNVNVFGVFKVARAVLPYMRQQRSGVIANMGSIAGWTALPLAGPYCASKFAVAGLSLALREESAHFGVEVTVIEPGHFRTDVLKTGGIRVGKPREALESYTKPVLDMYVKLGGTQPGDPLKGAQLIVEYLTKTGRCASLEGKTLPDRFALGSDAVKVMREVLARDSARLEEWASVSATTDFPSEQ